MTVYPCVFCWMTRISLAPTPQYIPTPNRTMHFIFCSKWPPKVVVDNGGSASYHTTVWNFGTVCPTSVLALYLLVMCSVCPVQDPKTTSFEEKVYKYYIEHVSTHMNTHTQMWTDTQNTPICCIQTYTLIIVPHYHGNGQHQWG